MRGKPGDHSCESVAKLLDSIRCRDPDRYERIRSLVVDLAEALHVLDTTEAALRKRIPGYRGKLR